MNPVNRNTGFLCYYPVLTGCYHGSRNIQITKRNMFMRFFLIHFILLITITSTLSHAQPMHQENSPSEQEIRALVREYRTQHQHAIIDGYIDLLSLPNHSYNSEDILRNADFIVDLMEKRDIKTKVYDGGHENPKNPVIYGERIVPNAERTLLFYAHYDGQRVIPERWTDSTPFSPVLRPGKLEAGTSEPKPIQFPDKMTPYEDDWRIYARSASDDKAPFIAILTAIDALIDGGIELNNSVKFVFDGAEEEGSTHLIDFIESNSELLTSDVVFICDGPLYLTGQPTLYFGNRGIQSLTLTVYGPNTNLHSGHYGNWAPNPAYKLARLLTSFKDKNGTVVVKSFYDTVTPLNNRELRALKELPKLDEQLRNQYEFAVPEGLGISLNELINRPSLNVRMLESGMNRTIIPHQASALMDIRLVKGTDGTDLVAKLTKHIENQGYLIVDDDPGHEIRMTNPNIAKITAGTPTPASRTSMELPVSLGIIATMTKTFDGDVALIPSLGGTIPAYMFTDLLDLPAIGVPIANPDNNQHQYDENIRIGNLWRGIEIMAALLMASW